MTRFLTNKRFWLFAPFVALFGLAVMAFGLWHYAGARISEEMAARGISWQNLQRHGFPARLSFDLEGARFQEGPIGWENDALSITLMPFQGGHAIADFHGPHRLTTQGQSLHLSHSGNLASLIVDSDGPVRASFEAQKPEASLRIGGLERVFAAQEMSLHARRSDTVEAIDVAMTTRQVSLPAQWGRGAKSLITRFDMRATLPETVLLGAARAGQKISLERVTLQRNGLTLVARGTLKLASSGYLAGKLDIDAIKLQALLDLLQEFDVVSARDRAKWLFLGGLGAAFGGTTQDRLSVPLQFRNERVFLGPLELGAAPRWR